ncbi:hypothetical protein A5N86_13780 [Geobacillus thermoleovorans]|uniref:Uncharacterized protein n=2 Tax=Geobacillus TaxID=129337 RepID=A0A7U9J855_GEOTM|nr:hypothetical protein GT3570_16970 [Geobacillus thermoleovorans]EQB97487.1 hypothetical protein GA8_00305 [Geobacillus sp. A8]ESU70757.1 hypothetical protein T260_17330 [Geobacillus sp. MAS1]KDE50704.1 hypothetical protein DI44_03000 [Geobacillus sp. CAMR5420]AWO74409.1 hypothetical protein C1N76_07740 [Geobacillus thermoleovorans]
MITSSLHVNVVFCSFPFIGRTIPHIHNRFLFLATIRKEKERWYNRKRESNCFAKITSKEDRE